ncbi:polymorphic toxin-type HINT domain-containing protein [Chitinophaga sp. NPDC101104]|uniref:polymorphic toxin-type HINT domain-containing protein n=1 Tax=Chitinophaga sp. NPDC101104 TaxID=3390561 RepID=UPI003CFC94B8
MNIPGLKFIYSLIAAACLLLLAAPLQAQQKKSIVLKKVLDGAAGQLAADSAITVVDSAFSNVRIDTPYPVRNIITFRINEYSNRYIPGPFSADAQVRIYYYLPNNVVDSVDQQLSINYDTAQTYRMRSSFVFNNAHKVKVKVLSITAPANMLAVLMLENEMEVQPRYKLDCHDHAIKSINYDLPQGSGTPDQLLVHWPVEIGADAYDLEWTYVDSSSLASGRYGTPLNPVLLFDNNTTRVTVADNSYQVPLMYDGKGTLFFRVRAVQVGAEDRRIETDWSSQHGATGQLEFAGHQSNLNWQSTITFAEDGKRKVVTQYFDGSLRGRQTVTKDNTSQTLVIAETMYDYQGRPAIQVLPSPTMETVMQYVKGFNRGINSPEYDKDKYDLVETPAEYLSGSAAPMDSASGANAYYSANNPLATVGHHQYIPQAKGRAFTQTEYTPDNTGRISRQGGLGETFKLGSGHETKYIYTTPKQEELDALFGTEVGNSSHYFKNSVVDANGQYSVSYIDMHGRTIATALQSVAPGGNLEELPETERLPVVESLSGPGKNKVDERSIVTHSSINVADTADYTFEYKLTPPVLHKQDCNGQDVCYVAGYELNIKVFDDAFNLKLTDPINYSFNNLDVSNLPVACGTTPAPIVYTVTRKLPPGNYTITKTLTISKEAMDHYRDSIFLQSNVCTTIEQIVEERRASLRTIQCVPDCAGCVAAIGTWEAFRVDYMTKAGIPVADTARHRAAAATAYQEAIRGCDELCKGPNPLNEIRRNMLMDVTAPTGQYAVTDKDGEPYNIFNAEKYKGANIVYLDLNGNRDTVWSVTQGKMVLPNELDREEFIANFKSSWAENLLPLHPEYCRLGHYELYRGAIDWQFDFEKTETFTAAVAKGYLNPANMPGIPFASGNDPLAALSGNKLADALNMTSAGRNMWTTATAMVRCNAGDQACLDAIGTAAQAFNPANTCASDLDMQWRNFRNAYINARNKIIMDAVNAQLCQADVGRLMNEGYDIHIRNPLDLLNNAGLDDFKNGGAADPGKANALAQGKEDQFYAQNCENYVQVWISQLKQCAAYDTNLIKSEIIPELLKVCREGADRDHYYGASTVKPSSNYRFRSFEDVIADFNTRHGITANMVCNANLITTPLPHGKQPVRAEKMTYTTPSDCECKTLTLLQKEYQTLKKAEDTTFSAYIFRVKGASIPQATLTILLETCNPNRDVTCKYLPSPVKIPTLIQCGVAPACVSCEEVKAVYDQYAASYPAFLPGLATVDSLQQAKNDFFARYMNNKFGYGLLAYQYIQFMDSCTAQGPGGYTSVCVEGSSRSKQLVNTYTAGGTNVINDIQRTHDNGYIMAGSTTGLGSGGKDAYIIKTDSVGNLLWARTFGAEANDELVRLKRTDDGGYIAIGTTNSYCYDYGAILILKLDGQGNLAWNKVVDFGANFGGKGTDILPVSGNQYAFGGLRTNTSGVATDWVAGLLDAQGEIQWLKQTGSTEDRSGLQLAVQGDILIGASSLRGNGQYDVATMGWNRHNGTLLGITAYDLEGRDNMARNILTTPEGLKVAVVNMSVGSTVNVNGALLDLGMNGMLLRASRVGGPGNINPETWSVGKAAGGGYFASQSNEDVYWMRLRDDNTVQWARQVRTGGSERLRSILNNPEGSMAGAGEYNGQTAMLMQTDNYGRTGCRDTVIGLQTTDITGSSMAKAVPAQVTVSLKSSNLSIVHVVETTNSAVQTALNCPGTDTCTLVPNGLMLCGNASPVFEDFELVQKDNCTDSTYYAQSTGNVIYKAITDSIRNDFDQVYVQMAQQAAGMEEFKVSYIKSEYHYTLYYYDQAGNLVKTVPPAGVVMRRNKSWTDSVAVARKAGVKLVPAHGMATNYRFNTLNQLVAQHTPDANKSEFWYDRLGRLTASQNAQQKLGNKYSYTLFDWLGRITEVGELTNSTTMTSAISRKQSDLDLWLTGAAGSRTQITKTVYDIKHAPFVGLALDAKNLRNRVAWSAVYDNATELGQGRRASGTFYSYDILGNVNTLVQDFNSRTTSDQANRFKTITYDFDLVSGKVNQVNYQPGQIDAFYHRYKYDAENRLTNVETSRDSMYWENDAYYTYYKHGPLARTVLGQQQVQGLDYAYTLEGWMKGLNSTSATSDADMGNDGVEGSLTAKDAVAFSLHYFGTNEYGPVNAANRTPFAAVSSYKPLYNGNISAITVNNPKVGVPMLYQYKYDVMNRMIGMDVYHGLNTSTNSWSPISVDDFKERVSYDPNGNILTYKRNGNASWAGKSLAMDDLTYSYKPGKNQLDHVSDPTDASFYDSDLDGQLAGNYEYDAIGNLTKDVKAGLDNVEWNAYGKIAKIVKIDGAEITYTYDVDGNRTSKLVGNVETRYVRDAFGNVMGIYVEGDNIHNSGKLTLIESGLYGSSRFGMINSNVNVEDWVAPANVNMQALGNGFLVNSERKLKCFEVSNYLGNVLATLSDFKVQFSSDNQNTSYYSAKVLSAQDYYPLGMAMPGRTANEGNYRYGFNGQEKSTEITSDGSIYTAEFWEYDSRIGRRWNLDPVPIIGLSQYATFNNNSIYYSDADGDFAEGGPDEPKRSTTQGFTDGVKKGLMTHVTGAQTQANRYLSTFLKPTPGGLLRLMPFSMITGLGAPEDMIEDFIGAVDAGREMGEKIARGDRADKAEVLGFVTEKVLEFVILRKASKMKSIKGTSSSTKHVAAPKTPALCFLGGTYIASKFGLKLIENIVVGDSVHAFNEKDGTIALKPVERLYVNEVNRLILLRFGLEEIKATPEHPFWINGKWIEAKDMRLGDSVKLYSGSRAVLSSINFIDTTAVVYNFSVSDYHTYFVGKSGILVHNSCFEPIKLRDGMKGGAQLNTAVNEVAAGRGSPRIQADGTHTVFEGRTATNGRSWAGALEYEVLVPGQPNVFRILKQAVGRNADGSSIYRYGYSTDHYKTTIHEFKKKTP